jgi:hypothetical protein
MLTEHFVGNSWVNNIHMDLRKTGYEVSTIFRSLMIRSNNLIFQMQHDDVEIEMNIY